MENTTLQYIEDYLHDHGKRLKLPEEINGAIIVAIEEMLTVREARLVEALELIAKGDMYSEKETAMGIAREALAE